MNLDTVDISKLPADVRKQFLRLQVMHAEKKIQNKAKNDFLSFVKCVWPEFVEGSHHRHIADKFNKLATGEINRLIINMPPRHTKSEFASYLLPAWMVGRDPKLKIIQATHTAELAVGFGRKVKNLIDSEDFRDVFPNVSLASDAKASGRWSTNSGGEYYAVGVGGALAGRGADLAMDAYIAFKMAGKLPNWDTIGKLYRPDQENPAIAAKRLFKTKQVKKMIQDKLKEVLVDKNIDEGFVLDVIKDAIEVAKVKEDSGNMIRAAKELSEFLDMKPKTKQVTESLEMDMSHQIEANFETQTKKLKATQTRQVDEKDSNNIGQQDESE